MNNGNENAFASHSAPNQFIDRRAAAGLSGFGAQERRQFSSSHHELSREAAELGHAMDRYKLNHRRRFINYEEMLEVIRSLGYRRDK